MCFDRVRVEWTSMGVDKGVIILVLAEAYRVIR